MVATGSQCCVNKTVQKVHVNQMVNVSVSVCKWNRFQFPRRTFVNNSCFLDTTAIGTLSTTTTVAGLNHYYYYHHNRHHRCVSSRLVSRPDLVLQKPLQHLNMQCVHRPIVCSRSTFVRLASNYRNVHQHFEQRLFAFNFALLA